MVIAKIFTHTLNMLHISHNIHNISFHIHNSILSQVLLYFFLHYLNMHGSAYTTFNLGVVVPYNISGSTDEFDTITTKLLFLIENSEIQTYWWLEKSERISIYHQIVNQINICFPYSMQKRR